MNASESSAGNTTQSKPGESVEDELTRFFAETSANDAKRKAPSVPVKGSILSFFKPPPKKESPTEAAASKPSPAHRPKKHFTARKPKEKSPPRLVEWSCESCTFDNSKQVSGRGWLACEMCGTSYMEEDTTRNQSESEAKGVMSKREDKKSTVVDLLNGSQKQRRKRQISTEVIVLDSDCDDDDPDSQDAVTPRLAKKARRSSSSSSSETIEIDIDCKPEATRKSEVCVIDVDRSVVTPASLQKQPSPSSSVLNFVVSKNSGRVSLYSAKTRQPLHFNFDIDQLLTVETADSLLNAQVKRSSSQARESGVLEKDVKFHDNSVQQGKFDPDPMGELVKSIIVSLPLLGLNSRL